MTRVIVLGAGMVGVCTAYELALRGYTTTLIDKSMPGQETSFGNAGLLQAEALAPRRLPTAIVDIAKMAFGHRNAVHFRKRDIWRHILPLAEYYRNSKDEKYNAITNVNAELIRCAITDHERLISAASAENLISKSGYITIFRHEQEFLAEMKLAEGLRDRLGLQFRTLDQKGLAHEEPSISQPLAGAIQWLESWTCSNPHALVAQYFELFQEKGGEFMKGRAISLRNDREVWRVSLDADELVADHVVIALGPWSFKFIQDLGYNAHMVEKRGYHVDLKTDKLPRHPLLDFDNSYVASPINGSLRITTGAEFSTPDAPLSMAQIDKAVVAAKALLNIAEDVENVPWLGIRPCTPTMLPIVGLSQKHQNLWFNFGHGHQGFTLGPTTSRILADCIETGKQDTITKLSSFSNILRAM